MTKREKLKARRSSFQHNFIPPSGLPGQAGGTLAVPTWLAARITASIHAACSTCQEWLDIQYGVAECTVCPLADFVKQINQIT